MRLNKFVAQSAGISRRAADALVQRGNVFVNGKPAIVGQQIDEGDKVALDGQLLNRRPYKYVLFNKPVGYVCSQRKQTDVPTVYDMLPQDLRYLQIAGRLDKDSSGLMLLSNDGDFIQLLTHPRWLKTKQYIVQLDRPLQESDRKAIEDGIEISDGRSSLALQGSGRTWRVTMQQGRNRQIRRTFGALGYTVIKLHRTHLGEYNVEMLEGEQYKVVDKLA